MNVVETAKAAGNFGTLLDLVEENGLTETLGTCALKGPFQSLRQKSRHFKKFMPFCS